MPHQTSCVCNGLRARDPPDGVKHRIGEHMFRRLCGAQSSALIRVNPTTHAVVAEAHAYNGEAFTGDAQSFQVPTIKSAKQALLSENERAMFVLDDIQGQLANLDLERGQVVQTFAPQSHGVDVPIESVTYANKFASENFTY